MSRALSDAHVFDYFSRITRDVALADRDPATAWGFRSYAYKAIDQITYFSRGMATRKKTVDLNTAARTATILQFAEKTGTADAWERAALYLRSHQAFGAAVTAFAKAGEERPDVRVLHQLSVTQMMLYQPA
jgi:hypothetical protein